MASGGVVVGEGVGWVVVDEAGACAGLDDEDDGNEAGVWRGCYGGHWRSHF